MAARCKQKQAGNSYNLQNRVDIPIKLQVEDDSSFLDEFSSQPSASQVLSGSDTSSDTDTSSTDWGWFFKRVLIVLIHIHRQRAKDLKLNHPR